MIARWSRTASFIVCVAMFCGHFAFAAAPIRYFVKLANPERHLVQVTIEIPSGENERELQLPVWNALYQVRDFSQYMNWIRAEDPGGKLLSVTELNESRWKIAGTQNGARVTYELFSDNPGPYGAQLDAHHAFFNLAEILCYIEGQRGSSGEVEIQDVPAGWKIATPLEQNGKLFFATNYDRLVDSPIEISAFSEKDFVANGGNYRVVVDADGAEAALDKIVPILQRIVTTETEWMNDRPFQTYTFIYHFSDSPGDGGMEHSYGTAITLPTRYLAQDLDRFEGITAHEFFHLWNVKRIRPQSLEPIDYTKENYTPALWFSEGVDSTVAGYIQLRAGLLDERGYLRHLSEQITELEDRPAHLAQSAEQSSTDAWLEKYSYYDLPARSISYYNKGELLGVLLDLKMREATDDRVSLQDLFRSMNEHYAKQGKFFPDSEGVRDAAEKLSHADFREFFEKYVSGVDEMPWDDFFSRVGLHVTKGDVTVGDPGFEAAQIFDQPLTVVQVEIGSDAGRAGLRNGDVIVEANGQAGARNLKRSIAELSPGVLLHLKIQRAGVEHELQWNLGSRKQRVFRIDDLPEVTQLQKSRRETWLFSNTSKNSQSAK
jgi:predicted metalloprotease with PDZ domain